MKKAFKNLTSFEFWQKFGKCLMVVIAVMPAAGLMISIGNSIPLINQNSTLLATIGNVVAQIGWAVIGNLHLLLLLVVAGLRNVLEVPSQQDYHSSCLTVSLVLFMAFQAKCCQIQKQL